MQGYRRKSGRHSSVESFSMDECSPRRSSHSSEDVVAILSNDEESRHISRKRPLSSSSSEYSQNNSPSSSAHSSTLPRSTVSDYLTRTEIEYSDWDIDREYGDDKDMMWIHDDTSWNSEVSTELSDDDLIYVNDFGIDHESAQAGELTQAQLHNMVTSDENLTSGAAIELLQQGVSFDWASNQLNHIPIRYDNADEPYNLWKCDNFFDYISIEGSPFKAVSNSNCSITELTTFTFDKWYMLYRNTKAKLDTSGGSFRTFRFAYSGRLQYFLVFQKTPDNQELRQNKYINTAIAKQHAVELSHYMIGIFTKFELLKRFGVNQESWSLLNQFKKSVDLDPSAFSLFQTEFFDGWKNFANSGSKYWINMIPQIHIYTYGGNQLIFPNYPSPDPYKYIIDDFNRNYNPKNISTISFAIASQLSVSKHYPGETDRHGNDYGVDLSLLASTEVVVGQYSSNKSQSGLRIFPAVFSPVVCNWQSRTIPKFYRDLTRPIVEKIERDNANIGVEYPLSFLGFQGYSAIQKQTHPDSSSFILGQSNYAAGHCISGKGLNGKNGRHLTEIQKMTASRHPLKCVEVGLKTVQDSGPIPYRFEPMISICLLSLRPENRNFEYIVREIIGPLLNIWDDNARTIGTELLLPFNKSVP
jgi:hypothetical protein